VIHRNNNSLLVINALLDVLAMPKILIIGATGYIGQALALSLVRSGGHTVYGLARTPKKAKSLEALEIIPVKGSVSDSANYLDLIRSANIDIVVDAAGANMESKKILEDLLRVGAERLEAAQRAGIKTAKLGFIYTSGTWVHGSSAEPVNDLTPVGNALAPTPPPKLVAWRPPLEQEILAASEILDVVVMRPALVYGGASSIWTGLFSPLLEAAKAGASTVSVKAEPNSMPSLIHVDDVASGLHAAVDKLPLIAGTSVYPVFDLVTSQESMRLVLETAAKALGFHGRVNMAGVEGDLFAEAMSTSLNGSSSRAIQLLGWQPKRFGYVQRMDLYARTWAASRE
jgi:nucleoside-diphosphate-sugar epimerase